ncbi:type IV pilus twitching motility protein PilT [Aquibacillus koreensis]|uniref:Type IV pilus twitching motility protein PilT n=1 Tax=Aquibacillus koreensis TaxID=279446 RepID=A0A9X3WKW8_9BACI|nr:type IV pilus twitching motility protein PilT [Aquibacillus koreensis]MCT2537945.1 type IV pilus twitching motility protein PilT [Aquibacillus koreensis]MDC3419164.1 type IV pilus twitching motility protein PilT [Aquibacillus koreensis]
MMMQFEAILRAAYERNASDIHLTVGTPPVLRINGDLQSFGDQDLRPEDTEQMAKSILTDAVWQQLQNKREVDLSYGISGVSRFRINVFHQRGCISLAIRIVPKDIPNLEKLQLPPVLKQIAESTQGLVLVTGPTGSGKSTTLAAMIDYMNNHMNKHIITLEDPIEYIHSHRKCIIDQREVGFDTMNFQNGLRACLRQDPDVILVGEMRDLETISTAITAAETGHLVLGTLHTTDAASTMDRIIDVFPAHQKGQIRIQLASVLEAIVSQRLFQTADKRGRVAATEVLINTSAIKNLIRNEKMHQIPNTMQTAKEQGMHTMTMDIKKLVRQGSILEEQALPYLKGRG